MIELRAKSYDDPQYDKCGNTTIAVIEDSGFKYALCEDCIKDLIESVHEFENTIFCYQCSNFRRSPSGWEYGGSCQAKSDTLIDPKSYGYIHCVNCMDTCKEAEKIQRVTNEDQVDRFAEACEQFKKSVND